MLNYKLPVPLWQQILIKTFNQKTATQFNRELNSSFAPVRNAITLLVEEGLLLQVPMDQPKGKMKKSGANAKYFNTTPRGKEVRDHLKDAANLLAQEDIPRKEWKK